MFYLNIKAVYLIKYTALFLLFVLSSAIFSQHQHFIHSLKDKTSFERRKAVYAYSESHAPFLEIKQNRSVFLKQVVTMAQQLDDTDLLNEVAFLAIKQSEIMNFSNKEKEIIILNKIEKTKINLNYLAFCYHELGQIYFQKNDYEKAFNYDLLSLSTYRKIGFDNVPNLNKILHEIALHHYFFENYNEVIELMKTSLKLSPFSPGIDIQKYNNLGLAYSQLDKTDSALFYYKEGLKCAESYNSNIWVGILNGNIANLYQSRNLLDSALFYSIKNFNFNKEENTHINVKINSYTRLANIFLELDSINKAEELMLLSKKLVLEMKTKLNAPFPETTYLGNKQQMENVMLIYYDLCKNYNIKIKNYGVALAYEDSLKTIKNEMQNQYNPTVVKLASNQFVLQNALASIQDLEKEKRTRVFIFYSTIIILITCVSFFNVYNYYKRKKKKKEVKLENLIIKESKELLKQELILAQHTLLSFKTKLKEQNTQIEILEKNIFELTKHRDKKTNLYEAQSLLEDLKKIRILTDLDWVNFQSDFQKSYFNFYKNLDSHVPIFTISEKRYLMLSKLGFNNKEMAGISGVSEGAIRITWKRIREKLGLSNDKTPKYFINKLDNEQDFS